MLKIKILKTGEVLEVTKNVAHGLIDSGKAVVYSQRMMTPTPEVNVHIEADENKQIKRKRNYKIK